MNDATTASTREFTQRRLATLQPYWLYASLALAAILILRPWMAGLFIAAITAPKVLLPARVRVEPSGFVLSAWLAERRIAWSEIAKAIVQGKRWRESIRLEGPGQARPVFFNIGYFGDRDGIARVLMEAAGAEHPLSRVLNPPPP